MNIFKKTFAWLATGIVALGLVWGFANLSTAAATTVQVKTVMGYGSGVHLGDGVVVTAAHVLPPRFTRPSHLEVVLRLEGPGGRATLDARILSVDRGLDVAILQFDSPLAKKAFPGVPWACYLPSVGSSIKVEGFPYDVGLKYESEGIIGSRLSRIGPWAQAMWIDVNGAPGMSGGPVFNDQGHVVGIITGITQGGGGFVPVMVPSYVFCSMIVPALKRFLPTEVPIS